MESNSTDRTDILSTPSDQVKKDIEQIVNRVYQKIEIAQAASSEHKQIPAVATLKALKQYLPSAPMPTDLCRVSPFFPIARKELGKRDYIEDMLVMKSNWGEIKYNGPTLSIQDEDVFLAVLALIDSHAAGSDKQSYTFTGPLAPILKLCGQRSDGKKEYDRVRRSLKLLASAVMEMIFTGKSTRGKRTTRKFHVSNMITAALGDEDKIVTITVNPYFAEMYLSRRVTLLDVTHRARLSGSVAKALYRFLESHRDGKWGEGHYLTLAAALNLDVAQEPRIIKRLINQAIQELGKKGFLQKGSQIKNDIVWLLKRDPRKPVPVLLPK